jgi:glutamate-ammonia-ligase adenylyltransferase
MTSTITLNQSGLEILNKIPALESYSKEELEKFPVPFGNPYLPKLNKDPLFHIRHKAWLECSLGTLTNKVSAKDVCSHWSQTADQVITEVFKKFGDASNIAAFALGKLGAQELNLSSDVDLLFVCKEYSAEAVKQVREIQNYLSLATENGFLFRCDLDLRPGGKTGALVPTLEQVIDYYGNYGETWERIALVRCRYICGSTEIRDELEPFLKRFVFRRHLDFSLFDDLKGLREKIQKAVKTDAESLHLKLAPGGIRDIELFTNALQVIHGGKNPQLQTTNTDLSFEKIKAEKILPSGEAEFFQTLYWRLRFLENYVQAQGDQQTHSIKRSGPHPPFIEKLLTNIDSDLEKSSKIVGSLLGNLENSPSVELNEDFQQILEIPLLSRNKERDQKTREIFVTHFSQALEKTSGDKSLAISLLKEFVTSVRAKSGLFNLLAREPKIAEDLAWLFGYSPYLAKIMCQRPELLDSFIYRSQVLQRDEVDILLEQLLEKRLLGEIIQGTEFLKKKEILPLLANLSSVADEIVTELLNVVNSDLRVLALGKWGGREIGFRSDLDFVFVSTDEPEEHHFKTARRIISRLTETHKGGSLFSIDMRLKPSGKAGPIIVKEESLIDYIQNSSQPWERQAYLKSRGLNWDAKKVREACYFKKYSKEEMTELNQIREKLIRPSELDLKYREGGLLDIELTVQTYLLTNDLHAKGTSTLEMLECAEELIPLKENYLKLRTIEQLLHLISAEGDSDLHKKSSYIDTLAALLNKTSQGFLDDLKYVFIENTALLKQLDPRRASS